MTLVAADVTLVRLAVVLSLCTIAHAELRDLEQQLRRSVGLSGPDKAPNTDAAWLQLHNYMHELHAKMLRDGGFMTVSVGNSTRNLGYVSAVHSFLDVQRSELHDSSVFHFNVTDIPPQEDVLAAELRLHIRNSQNHSTWLVYELLDDGQLQPVHVASSNASLLALDLTESIRRWRRQQRALRLLVRLTPNSDPTSTSTSTPTPAPFALRRSRRDAPVLDALLQPNIIVFTKSRDLQPPNAPRLPSRRAQRTKRNARRLARRKRNRICSLQRMEVDFDRVGWSDWIIAPLSYEAGICVGTCNFPLSDQVNATNHAIVQALVHSVNSAIPSPCCVPTKLTAIALLFQDHAAEKVILKNYSDMVAEACGCR